MWTSTTDAIARKLSVHASLNITRGTQGIDVFDVLTGDCIITLRSVFHNLIGSLTLSLFYILYTLGKVQLWFFYLAKVI